jgi:cytochrome c peroxidase
MKNKQIHHHLIGGFTALSWLLINPPTAHAQSTVNTLNASGYLQTTTLDGAVIDQKNPFFNGLGNNGRTCNSCHVASTAWTISPDEIQDRFLKTRGLDPVFRTVDGANSPNADVTTPAARLQAYSMLLKKGVIRIGLPIPPNAEFVLDSVDDPYSFASAAELSLFRRPLPSTNLRFLTGVMWDGRESFAPLGTTPISSAATPMQNRDALVADLKHQANDAVLTHAQGTVPLSDATATAIADFELNLATAQQFDFLAGDLDSHGADGGAANLAQQPFYVTINDVLGADVLGLPFNPESMTLYQPWAPSQTEPYVLPGAEQRAAIARGAALFGAKPISITGVGGLNDVLNLPTIQGTCTTCHDTPNVGNHSVALPIDIGVTDEQFRTADMPLYTLRNLITGQVRKTSDPGRALLTGKWADIGKFKGPVLRGLASRPPYFHNGMAADLSAVIDFYNIRFGVGITADERADLIAFLNSL